MTRFVVNAAIVFWDQHVFLYEINFTPYIYSLEFVFVITENNVYVLC